LTISDADREKLFATSAQAYSKLPGYNKPFKATLLDAATRQILSDAGRRPQTDRHKANADELIFLGLYDEAAPEYEAGLIYETSRSSAEASRQTALPANAAYTLAELYSRGDRGDRAAALFRSLWNVPADYPAEMMDPEYARFIYPAPYKDVLLLNAQPRGVDPRFLLAIIRQESGFRPNVKSNAAARGLMQFISTTARQTAQSLSRPDFRDDDLYDPRTSILFGSRYTEQLFALFPGLPDAVAAAYNGGEDNMKRWLARSRSRTPERYVPEISFAQSKDYVHRVISNYRVYQMLYDENLDAKPATFRSRER
jgi:soluble lytic murein transglycosylase